MTNLHGLSPSSCISEEVPISGERQFGLWKRDNLMDRYGAKADGGSCTPCTEPVVLSSLEKSKSVRSQTSNCLETGDEDYLALGCMFNLSLQRKTIGAERAAHSLSLWNPMEHGSGERRNLSGHFENGLFSSSMSELFSRKLTLPLNNASSGHSVDTATLNCEEEEPLESLEEIEAQTIGNLLPNDDDLFSGVVDGIKQIGQSSGGDDVEDIDFFCSIGGMDLGDDSSSGGPRNSDFSGGVSTSQPGASNISALSKHPYGSFLLGSITSTCLKSHTGMGRSTGMQAPAGSLGSVFNHGISSSVPNGLPSLMQVELAGNHFGLPESGNSVNQTKYNGGMLALQPHSLPEYHDGLANAAACNISLPPERVEIPHFGRISTNGHSLEMGSGLDSSRNSSCCLSGHHYMLSNSNRPQVPTSMWPSSSTFSNGLCTTPSPSGFQRLGRTPSHMMTPVLSMNDHIGSAPSINPLWDRRNAYPGGSPEASTFHRGSLGNMELSGSPLCNGHCVSHNTFSCLGGNCMEPSFPSKNGDLHSHYQRCMVYAKIGQINPMANTFEPLNERPRSHRNESSSHADNKKQYELDIDRILRGEDTRTTLMVKNIPNKYTSKMLMTAIDECHRGTYDFIYLPIDFKNKCNVGYAFINMIDPSHIIPFYETFNGKKWAKFNSEKVASLAYARIQGKAALIGHFQNSSLMNEDKRCRPILFHTNGPNAGDQVPLPMGVSVRSRAGKPRTGSSEDNHNHRGSGLKSTG